MCLNYVEKDVLMKDKISLVFRGVIAKCGLYFLLSLLLEKGKQSLFTWLTEHV